ncbi:MAG TPA: CopG family antitoxin [Stellaceae bacterium]|nr:CopG family antitoxin [Stellaceae bacterium]
MRLPKALLEAVKRRSAERGIPYTRFIREAVELALHRKRAPRRRPALTAGRQHSAPP